MRAASGAVLTAAADLVDALRPHILGLLPSPASPTMPKIRTSRTKQPPEGFEDIEAVSALLAPSKTPKDA